MIKFFRQIRKTLLMENKTSKYLKYAIGEIVLVVIGILIALQVNNWNENQKTKATEQTILKSLLKEFQANEGLLNQQVLLNLSNISNAKEIGKLTGPDPIEIDEKKVSELMFSAFASTPFYDPSLGTLQDIMSSGQLSTITNQELRSELASFESALNGVQRQEKVVEEEQQKAHQYLIAEGNFRRHLTIALKPQFIIESDFTASKFPPNRFTFLGNQEFENHLYLYIAIATSMDKYQYNSIQAKQDTIIKLIKNEIK